MRPAPEPFSQVRLVGVSIPVPDPHGPYLQAKRVGYADPVAATTIPHVTLLGPTKVGPDGLPALMHHLERVAGAAAPFEMSLHGTGTFRPRSRVVFVQVAGGSDVCHSLESAIRVSDCAPGPDFPFHPHVTVAHNVTDAMLDAAHQELANYHVRFPVDAFVMYELDPEGVWQPVRSFPLGGASNRS